MEIINVGIAPEDQQRFEDSVFDADDVQPTPAPGAKVLTLTKRGAPEVTPDIKNMLDVLDVLRANIVAGKVIAYAAVSIAPDDEASMYSGASEHVSRLRMLGGISFLHSCYLETSHRE